MVTAFNVLNQMEGNRAMSAFGDWLKQKRKSRNWSQKKLSEIASVSDATISFIETDKRKYTREMVESLATALLKDVSSDLDKDVDAVLTLAGFVPLPKSGAFPDRIVESPEEYVLESGMKIRIRTRLGDPGKPLKITPNIAAIFESLATVQNGEQEAD